MAPRHKHAPWRRLILVPVWIVQTGFLIIMIGLLSLSIGVLSTWDDDRVDDLIDDLDDDKVRKTIRIFFPIWLAISCICLILTITEIVLLARHKLKPLVFLTMNSFKTVTWTVLFILDIISLSSNGGGGRTSTVVGILVDGVLFLAFWIPLIYGTIIFFRTRKRAYAPVNRPSTAIPMDAPYPQQYKELIVEEGRPNVTPSAGKARRMSYNHQRDTRFESYRNERSFSNGSISERNIVTPFNPNIPQVHVQHHDVESQGTQSGVIRYS